jgi:glycosyltransferase involved in cell wall biosynthesis
LNPRFSLIIPAFNEEARLPSTIRQVARYLQSQPYSWEILVVDNASTDATAQVVERLQREVPNLYLLHEPVRGKGAAVRTGMLAAQGEFRFICDADLSMPIEELEKFLPPTLEDFDIAIASREVPGAVRINEPAYRHWIGRVFNAFVRLIALPGLQDTQCGFKCFRAAAAEDLFPRQTIHGWTFDVEILFLARQRGYRIVEVPIRWVHIPGSRVRILHDSVAMFLDLLRIRRNWLRGRYGHDASS